MLHCTMHKWYTVPHMPQYTTDATLYLRCYTVPHMLHCTTYATLYHKCYTVPQMLRCTTDATLYQKSRPICLAGYSLSLSLSLYSAFYPSRFSNFCFCEIFPLVGKFSARQAGLVTGATRARWTGRGARGFLDKRKGLVNFKEKVKFLQTVKKMCFMPKKG